MLMKSIINHRFKRTSSAGGLSNLAKSHLAKLIRPAFGLAALFSVSISNRGFYWDMDQHRFAAGSPGLLRRDFAG